MDNCRILTLLSGKGGAGKTVTALSIVNLLSKVGKKVLLIDCDISTHGATYFFENLIYASDSITSLQDIMNLPTNIFRPLLVSENFNFIPSTKDISNTEYQNTNYLSKFITDYKYEYNAIILDCQAGFSPVTNCAVSMSDKNLIVMEADSISASAVRSLFLQIGNRLNTKNTVQIFNKLSDDERTIYNKISAGTFFPNLPAIPFDWKVRASFALGNIPDILTKESAFGIGVIRLSKFLFAHYKNELTSFEDKIVGDWFGDIRKSLDALELEKAEADSYNSIKRRNLYQKQMTFIATMVIIFSLSILAISYFDSRLFFNIGYELLIGIAGILLAMFLLIRTKTRVKQEEIQDESSRRIKQIESEIERYKTLISTDPRLSEFYNESINNKSRELMTSNEYF